MSRAGIPALVFAALALSACQRQPSPSQTDFQIVAVSDHGDPAAWKIDRRSGQVSLCYFDNLAGPVCVAAVDRPGYGRAASAGEPGRGADRERP